LLPVLKIGPEKTHHRSKILQIDTEDTEKNLEKISSLLLCDLCASVVKSLLFFIFRGAAPGMAFCPENRAYGMAPAL